MKYLFVVLMTGFLAACSGGGQVKNEVDENEKEHGHENVSPGAGKMWKADSATKVNVASLAKVINDSSYLVPGKREALYLALRSGVDTLVRECRMQGPDHDALHGWLEKLQKDMQALKEKPEDYRSNYAVVKKDIDEFDLLFE